MENIKDKYHTISETSKIIGVPSYVLRFWEKEFLQIKPYKYKGRRYYLPKDIELIKNIKELLYTHGYTIEGAKKQLNAYRTNKKDTAIELTETVQQDTGSRDIGYNNKVIHDSIRKLRKIKGKLIK